MMPIKKALMFWPMLLITGLFQPGIARCGDVADGVDAISTNNYANKSLEYYYYIPKGVRANKRISHPLLVAIPGLSGGGKAFVGKAFKDFADREKFIIVAPSFMYDEKNWESEKSYQYPAVWSGNALLAIVNQLKNKNGLNLSKFYLFGASAGAQFALRFCLWRPNLCAACAVHASGGTVEPDRKVKVRFFVTVGTRDTPERIEKAQSFYQSAREYGIDVTFKQYPTSHALIPAQIEDSLVFFKKR